MMNEKPIIFSDPMVRAILAGKKTVTRRIVNMDRLRVRVPRLVHSEFNEVQGMPKYAAKKGVHHATMNPYGAVSALVGPEGGFGLKPDEFHFVCPYTDGDTALAPVVGAKEKRWTITPHGGSKLWVREAWRVSGWTENAEAWIDYRADGKVLKRDLGENVDEETWVEQQCDLFRKAGAVEATGEGEYGEEGQLILPDGVTAPWRSPIYLPRWACRLELSVVSVRLEHLHDIDDADATLEGITEAGIRFWPTPENQFLTSGERASTHPYRAAYAVAWDKINGHRATWKSNPWVWRIEFSPLGVAASSDASASLETERSAL